MILIEPHGVSLPAQVQGELFLHFEGFLPGHRVEVDMVVEAGTQVAPVFFGDAGGELVALAVHIAGLVLLEATTPEMTSDPRAQPFLSRVRNVARAVAHAVGELRAGRLKGADEGLAPPRVK